MIRFMQDGDEKQLKRLVYSYLKETFEQGGDFPATLDNAAWFTKMALDAAKAGDPCLVAIEDEKIMGYVMGVGVFFPGATTRDITLRSWGTYIVPAARGQRLAIKLFMVLGRVAKMKGYTRILGVTHGSDYADKAMMVVKSIVGMKEIGKVLMWKLSAPTLEESNNENVVPTDAVSAE